MKYKTLPIIMLIVFLLASCGTKKTYTTNQINPIDKDTITSVKITKVNTINKDFTDKILISNILTDLNKITVTKLSTKQDNQVMENGDILKKDSTITLNLFDAKGNIQSTAILLSDTQLYLPDVKSMQSNNRTTSYLSTPDNEQTLKAIKDLYSLLNKTVAPITVGLTVNLITFHEDFRPPGLKAVDVGVVCRSRDRADGLQEGDEIVEIVGTTGKTYNMAGSKGTGLEYNPNNKGLYEQRIVQYNDVDENEENITKVIFQYHTGERVELQVKGIKPVVTHK